MKFKSFFYADLAKVFSLTTIASVTKMGAGLLSSKILALLLGPAGIAYITHIGNFVSLTQTFSTGGINMGITKFVAQNHTFPSKKEIYISNGFKITFVLSVIATIVCVLFAKTFSLSLFRNEEYKYVFHFFGATLILFSFNKFFIAILNGLKEYKKFVLVNISNSIVGLVFTVVLVYLWGLKGALISVVTYQSVVFFITIYQIKEFHLLKLNNLLGKINKPAILNLLKYSIMAGVSAVIIPITQIFVRNYITKKYSITEAGLWSGMNSISNAYLTMITYALSTFLIPKFSELKTSISIKKEIFRTIKFVLPLFLLLLISLYFSRKYIILILFSQKFSEMSSLFLPQLTGDFFKIISWIIALQLLVNVNLKFYVFSEIFFGFNYLLLVVLLVGKTGFVGATLAYAINYIMYFIVILFFYRKQLFFK
ncbi:MAG: O-antigen translocase [Bacteroidales bacterium]